MEGNKTESWSGLYLWELTTSLIYQSFITLTLQEACEEKKHIWLKFYYHEAKYQSLILLFVWPVSVLRL